MAGVTMKAKCEIKTVTLLREQRVQLQGTVFASTLVVGNFALQVPRGLAESWANGQLEPGAVFEIQLPQATAAKPAANTTGTSLVDGHRTRAPDWLDGPVEPPTIRCHPGLKCTNWPECESCGPPRL
jgi:hypothetical protein